MNTLPVITLNNSDGYDAKQMNILNSMIMAERNRWDRLNTQTVNKADIGDIIKEVNGTVSSSQSQYYAGFVSIPFYITIQPLEIGKEYKIMSLKKKLKSFTLYGTKYMGEGVDGNIAFYCKFFLQDGDLYLVKLRDEILQFRCLLNGFIGE